MHDSGGQKRMAFYEEISSSSVFPDCEEIKANKVVKPYAI